MSTYMNYAINTSPTVVFPAASDITDVPLKAIKLDSNGKAVVASTAGEVFLGLALHITGDEKGNVKAGNGVDILIKEIGFAIAGAAVSAGAPLATDANGNLVTATAGQFVIGYAMTSASAAGDHIQVQIVKGWYPTASST